MDDLIRLVYVNRSTQLDKGERHIQAVNEEIIYEAQAFNEAIGITGIFALRMIASFS